MKSVPRLCTSKLKTEPEKTLTPRTSIGEPVTETLLLLPFCRCHGWDRPERGERPRPSRRHSPASVTGPGRTPTRVGTTTDEDGRTERL